MLLTIILLYEEAQNFESQVPLGEGMRSDMYTWRHTCFTLDFIAGTTKLFENGKKYYEKTGVEDIKKTYEIIDKQIDIVSVG